MRPKVLFLLLLGGHLSLAAAAQNDDAGVAYRPASMAPTSYRIKAGFHIGGAVPLGLPREIESIDSYNPQLHLSLEAEALRMFTPRWGMAAALRVESKGMRIGATVSDYALRLTAGDREIDGLWTGRITATLDNTLLTLPLLVVWQPADRWRLKLGPTISYRLDGSFHGYALDGYIREGSPIGEKIGIDEAFYNFSSDLRRWHLGGQLGVEWRALPHLLACLDFSWSFRTLFKSNFHLIHTALYPLSIAPGFAYSF
jgi:hypothetical protein